MASPADDGDGEILVRNVHLSNSDILNLPDELVYVVYRRRWYILAVVSILNISNAMVRGQILFQTSLCQNESSSCDQKISS